jgi:hypothetical protein
MADYGPERRLEKVKSLCTTFRELKCPLTPNHVQNLSRDVFDDALKRTQTGRDDLCVKQVVTVLCDTITDETLESPSRVCLEKWLLLRTCVSHLLRMWHQNLSIDGDVYNTVTMAFDVVLSIKVTNITNANIDTIKSILLEETFVNEIVMNIKKASTLEPRSHEKSSHKSEHSQVSYISYTLTNI